MMRLFLSREPGPVIGNWNAGPVPWKDLAQVRGDARNPGERDGARARCFFSFTWPHPSRKKPGSVPFKKNHPGEAGILTLD